MLDEISEIPPAMQAKLLRVLQEREVERIGGKKVIKLDVRVLAETGWGPSISMRDGLSSAYEDYRQARKSGSVRA